MADEKSPDLEATCHEVNKGYFALVPSEKVLVDSSHEVFAWIVETAVSPSALRCPQWAIQQWKSKAPPGTPFSAAWPDTGLVAHSRSPRSPRLCFAGP